MAFNLFNKEKRNLPTKGMLVMKIAVAVYLYYLAFDLREHFISPQTRSDFIIIAAVILFIVGATFVVITSGKDLMTGRYEGGALDPSVNETDEDEDSSL